MLARLSLARYTCVALAIVGAAGVFAACGSDNAPATVKNVTPTATSPGVVNDTKTEPILPPPASKYSLLFEDVGNSYISDIAGTYTLTVDNYAKTGTFAGADGKPNEVEGRRLLALWGYQGGFETGYIPEGRIQAVLNGAFYITLELHLFATVDGAKQAYDYFEGRLKGSTAVQAVTAPTVGNRSTAWRRLSGTKVGSSSQDAVLHTVIMRRGNLLTVVVTQGADSFMKVDSVLEAVRIVDQKALGQKPAVEPTPSSNFVTPTPQRASATATATASAGAGR